MTDDLVPFFAGKASGDLLGRPATGKAIKNCVTQGIIAFEPGTCPAAGRGLCLSIGWLVANFAAAVPLQLAGNRRRLAIQSCSNLPDRLPGFMKPGNRTALFK